MRFRSPVARRVLLAVAKILQGVASGVPFGSKEPYMAPANAFLEMNRADLVRAVSILWCVRGVLSLWWGYVHRGGVVVRATRLHSAISEHECFKQRQLLVSAVFAHYRLRWDVVGLRVQSCRNCLFCAQNSISMWLRLRALCAILLSCQNCTRSCRVTCRCGCAGDSAVELMSRDWNDLLGVDAVAELVSCGCDGFRFRLAGRAHIWIGRGVLADVCVIVFSKCTSASLLLRWRESSQRAVVRLLNCPEHGVAACAG